jgi:phosphoribosylanthranilate isomerase
MSEEKVKKPRKAAVKKSETAAVGTVKAKAAPRASSSKKVVAPNGAEAAIAVKVTPSHEQIAALAHRLYVERGWLHGFHEQDWLRAEELLKAS